MTTRDESERGGESATSRRTIRAAWAAMQTDEESRLFLQTRLAVLFKLMFWSLLLLVAFLAAEYAGYPSIAPRHRDFVYLIAVVGLAAMVVIWRVLLVRRDLSIDALYAIDLAYSIGIGTAFGASALLQRDLRPAGYMSLVYSTFTVFARALIMPSSARRTLGTSIATYVPLTGAALALAITTEEELPAASYFFGYLLLSVVPVVLATFGSHIIYGLRRQVSAAKQLGQYTIERKLGEGGMGAVYRAHHVLLRRPTAVKLLIPERMRAGSLERFEREVHHTSQLTHPNTVAVYDYGRSHDGTFYYAMEDLGDGIDLQKLVVQDGPQPVGRVIQILAQVCGALQEAHDLKIVHRDIKPANVLLCERGGVADVAKVVDFGLVKEITADAGATTNQIILGTPDYIAPEAVTDPANVGPAIDLYALGAVGYFLLTGHKVFTGKTAMDLCIQHVNATPPRPSSVTDRAIPAALDDLILRCLAKRPADRPASASALADELLAIAPGEWSHVDAESWWQARRGKHREIQTIADARTVTLPIDLGDRRLVG